VTPNGQAERSLSAGTCHGWPAWRLQQGGLVLQVLPSVGGRLMGIAWQGRQLCFVHEALAGQPPAPDDAARWPAQCVGWPFPLWGGGKTWIAPQADWPDGEPHRDLDSGAWTLAERWCDADGMGLHLVSPVCRRSGLQLQRRLLLPAGGTVWHIDHTLSNHGPLPRRCGLWDVLMLRRPAVVQARLHHGGAAGTLSAVAGMPALDALAAQGLLSQAGPALTLRCDAALMFKCGLHPEAGMLDVVLPPAGAQGLPQGLPQGLRYRRWSATDGTAAHAHGHPVEVFNAPDLPYFEVESHSPLATLAPGQSLTWRVHEQIVAA